MCWMGKQHSVFQKFQVSQNWCWYNLFRLSNVSCCFFALHLFCFSWHLSDSFISPVMYIIFSLLTPPSLSRVGKLQVRQISGPGSRLAGAFYPVIYPGQAYPCFLSTAKACLSDSWWLIEMFAHSSDKQDWVVLFSYNNNNDDDNCATSCGKVSGFHHLNLKK